MDGTNASGQDGRALGFVEDFLREQERTLALGSAAQLEAEAMKYEPERPATLCQELISFPSPLEPSATSYQGFAGGHRKHSPGLSVFSPAWVNTMQEAMALLIGVSNFLARLFEQLAPIARFLSSPKVQEFAKGMMAFAALMEEHEGDQRTVILAIASYKVGHRADTRRLDSLLRTKLEEDISRHGGDGGEMPLSYFWQLLNHYEARALRAAQITCTDDEAGEIRSQMRSFPSLDAAIASLAGAGETKEQARLREIKSAAYVEQTAGLNGKEKVNRVSGRIRREGPERPDEPGLVTSSDPNHLTRHSDVLELAAFAERQHLAAMACKAGLSTQEWESLRCAAVLGNQDAAAMLGRTPGQVAQEKHRALKKLRAVASA